MRFGEAKSKLYKSGRLKGINMRKNGEAGSYIENMLFENGALRKRQGTTDIMTIETEEKPRINGIYDLNGEIVIHSGTHLYSCSSLENEPHKIESEIELENEASTGVCHNKMLWLSSGNKLYIYDGKSLYEAYGSPLMYIPTTWENIRAIGEGDRYKTGEKENLLSPFVKNTLFGTDRERAIYMLDGEVEEGEPFYMEGIIDISLLGGEGKTPYHAFKESSRILGDYVLNVIGITETDEIDNLLSDSGTGYGLDLVLETNIFFKDTVRLTNAVLYARADILPRVVFLYGNNVIYDTGDVKNVTYLDLKSALRGKVIDNITIYGNDKLGRISRIKLEGEKSYEGEVKLYYEEESLELGKPYYPKEILTPLSEKLTLSRDKSGAQETGMAITLEKGALGTRLITVSPIIPPVNSQTNLEITYKKKGLSKEQISIVAPCKSDTGASALAFALNDNRVALTSDEQGCFYCSDVLSLGGDKEEILAISDMDDYKIGIFKRDGVYILEKLKEGAKCVGFVGNLSVTSKNAVIRGRGEVVALTEGGFYGVNTRSEAYLRSNTVGALLKNEDTKNVCLAINGAYLYAFVGNGCYVANLNERSYDTQRSDSGYSYEWFYFSGIRATSVININNKLYFGTENGKIYTQSNDFYDTTHKKLPRNMVSIGENDLGDTDVYFDSSLNVTDGTGVKISQGYNYLSEIESAERAENNLIIKVPENKMFQGSYEVSFYEGEEIYLVTDDKTNPYPATVLEVDYENLLLLVRTGDLDLEYTAILEDVKDKEYEARQRGSYFRLFKGEKEVRLFYDELPYISLVYHKRVEGLYQSERLSIDGFERLKSLYRINLDLGKETEGEIEVGYITNRSSFNKKLTLGKAFSYNSLDFSAFDFASALDNGVYIRCFERGFSSIVIKIKSISPSPLILNGFSLGYSLNGLLKGDR